MMNRDAGLQEAINAAGGVGALAQRDEVDLARSREYALLATLLLRAPDAAMLAQLSRLQGTPTPLGLAHLGLADAASAATNGAVQREYFELFIGVGRGEFMPYASYYLTGFLNERPLANVREELKRLGLSRGEGTFEPEDHLGTLCEVMSGLAEGRFGVGEADERAFFSRHMAPWAGRFFLDLEMSRTARFYRAVGLVGRTFLEIESEAFAMDG